MKFFRFHARTVNSMILLAIFSIHYAVYSLIPSNLVRFRVDYCSSYVVGTFLRSLCSGLLCRIYRNECYRKDSQFRLPGAPKQLFEGTRSEILSYSKGSKTLAPYRNSLSKERSASDTPSQSS